MLGCLQCSSCPTTLIRESPVHGSPGCRTNNLPRTAWLSDNEKRVATLRLQHDVGVVDDDETSSVWDSVKAGAKDPKLWLMGVIYAAMTTAGGYSAFVPTVVKTFGKSKIETYVPAAADRS